MAGVDQQLAGLKKILWIDGDGEGAVCAEGVVVLLLLRSVSFDVFAAAVVVLVPLIIMREVLDLVFFLLPLLLLAVAAATVSS